VAIICHFLFATADARFACPEIKLGVYPPVLAAVGDRRLGGLVCERLLLTGGELDAATGERLGLLTARFAAGEDPEEAILAWYRDTLEPLSAFALRQGTRAARVASGFLDALDRGLAASERQYVDEVLASHDGNEGRRGIPREASAALDGRLRTPDPSDQTARQTARR
jgi:enoyl-CoA hydratase